MVMITLVGKKQAKEGFEFIYMGPLSECRECKLKTVCFNLDEGAKYRVKQHRQKNHDCGVYYEGVSVVEVERVPMFVAIESHLAMDGSSVKIEGGACKNIGCENHTVCFPAGFNRNSKYKITRTVGEIHCPHGKKLKKIEVEQQKE